MMATAFISAVLETFPKTQVDLIVKSGFEKIPLPHRGRVLSFDKSSISAFHFGKLLRKEGYNRIYILPPSFSSALMAFSAKIPERIGYKMSLRGFLLTHGVLFSTVHRSQHLVSEYLQLLDPNLNKDSFAPVLNITDDWLISVLNHRFDDLPTSYIAIAPGVVYGPAKQWPKENFRQLISDLEKKGENVVIIGTSDDKPLGDYLAKSNKSALNLCGKTSLNELIAVLARSKTLISNDSGTMHIMAALQKPQIAVFGSTSTVWTSPVNEKAEVLTLNMDCAPCFKRECPFNHYDCLNGITTEMVMEKITALSRKYGF